MRIRNRSVIVGLTAVVGLASLLLIVSGALTPWVAGSGSSAPVGGATLNLTITFDTSTGVAQYAVTDLSIPVHTFVLVRISNYDPRASAAVPAWAHQVLGTVGDFEVLSDGAGARSISSLPATGVSHTFTVVDRTYNISVPIPPAPGDGTPSVVTFLVALDAPEVTAWEGLCHPIADERGDPRMNGTLVIE